MDGDIFFQFGPLLSGMAARAARLAVIMPLFGPATSRDMLLQKAGFVQYAWRARVDEMCRFGVVASRRNNWQRRARNCFPAFTAASPRTFFCDSPTCPLCYARKVARVYQAAEHSFEDLFGLRPGTSPWWILERRLKSPLTWPDPVAVVRGLSGRGEKRAEQMKRFQAAGGYTFCALLPGRYPNDWVYSLRQLFRVPAGIEYDAAPGESIRVHEHPTRTKLASAVARTCAYPRKWLRAPMSRMAPLLDARAEVRVRDSSFLGDFYGQER